MSRFRAGVLAAQGLRRRRNGWNAEGRVEPCHSATRCPGDAWEPEHKKHPSALRAPLALFALSLQTMTVEDAVWIR